MTQAQKDQILTDLKSPQLAPYVEQVFFESKQEAFDRFRQQFKDSVLSDNVTVDQMPESYRVRLKNPQQYQVVSQVFANRPGIESVEDQRKVLDQLFSLLNRLTFYSWVLAVITLACTTLLVATTIRLTAFTRRRETGIMRLVGASNVFIQLPFILESVIAAILGAVLASAALIAVTHFEIQGRLSHTAAHLQLRRGVRRHVGRALAFSGRCGDRWRVVLPRPAAIPQGVTIHLW